MRADPKGAAAAPGAVSDAGDVEVVASGTALSIVSGWLGMSAEEALAEAGPSVAALAPLPSKRPQFLGLGAKYLPHHKAVEAASALDAKLRRRLERGVAARREAEAEEAEMAGRAAGGVGGGGGGGAAGGGPRGPHAAVKGRGKGIPAGPGGSKRPGGGGHGPDGDSDSEGEERKGSMARRAAGRAHAHAHGPGTAPGAGGGPGPAAAAGAAAVGSRAAREAQLLYAPIEGGGRKGKKKGKRQRVGDAPG